MLTEAFNLPANFVIHAVAPRYLDGSRGEVEVLAETYCAICDLVKQYRINTISIPSIGTGIYRFPLQLAADVAIETLKTTLPIECHARFVCFDEVTLGAYSGTPE